MELFTNDAHVEVETIWRVYQQQMISAYRHPDRARGRTRPGHLIDTPSTRVPTELTELITLGRTLKRRAADVLAYSERPGTSNGPTAKTFSAIFLPSFGLVAL